MQNQFTKLSLPTSIFNEIQRYLEKEKNIYRNPTEFINECVRIRLWELRRAEIDQRKLDAFFMKANEMRTKDASLPISSHNRKAS